jgi:hypothetical protein
MLPRLRRIDVLLTEIQDTSIILAAQSTIEAQSEEAPDRAAG